MKYKLIFFIILYGLFSHCRPAHAFFAETGRRDGIRIDSYATGPDSEPRDFYLYDNFSCTDRDHFLIKKAEGFISADRIRIDIPLKILSRNISSTENSLDRMLMANLRIKQLLAEYKKLREKARILLKTTRLNESLLFVPQKHEKSRPASGSLPEEPHDAELDRQIFNITRLSPASGDVMEDHKIISENGTEHGPGKKNIIYRALTRTDNDPGTVKSDVAYPARPVTAGRNNDELPWIFNFLLKIINYTLNNRVEILLYLIFIALAGYIISLQARR